MSNILLDHLEAVLGGRDPNVCDQRGRSLLDRLLLNHYENIAKHIVQTMNSEQVNFVTQVGDSLLETAIFHGSQEIAELLIAKGANYNNETLLLGIGSRISEELILKYFDFSQPTNNTDFINIAYQTGCVELVNRFLDAGYPIPPDILNRHFSPKDGMEDICLRLLDLGVNPLIPALGEIICLSIAIDVGYSRLALRLLEFPYFFDYYITTYISSSTKRTLLYGALEKNMIEVVKKLLSKGYDYDPMIEELELSVEVQRMLSARYPEYQQRHPLRLNEVQYANLETRSVIHQFTLANSTRPIELQLPLEMLEEIYKNL